MTKRIGFGSLGRKSTKDANTQRLTIVKRRKSPSIWTMHFGHSFMIALTKIIILFKEINGGINNPSER